MILEAATRLFAERGLEGATTRALAKEVGVSEALLFLHFPSKEAIYEAVMERSRERQNAWREAMGANDFEASTLGLMTTIVRFIYCCTDPNFIEIYAPMARLRLAAIGGNTEYSRSSYARNFAAHIDKWSAALAAAQVENSFDHELIDPANAMFFVEHVGMMLIFMNLSGQPIAPYRGKGEALAVEAARFCCGGIGLSQAAVEQYLPQALKVARKDARMRRKQGLTSGLEEPAPALPARSPGVQKQVVQSPAVAAKRRSKRAADAGA